MSRSPSACACCQALRARPGHRLLQTWLRGSNLQAWKSLIMPSRRPSSASHCCSTAVGDALQLRIREGLVQQGLSGCILRRDARDGLQAQDLVRGNARQVERRVARDHAIELQRQALRGHHGFAATGGAAHEIGVVRLAAVVPLQQSLCFAARYAPPPDRRSRAWPAGPRQSARQWSCDRDVRCRLRPRQSRAPARR